MNESALLLVGIEVSVAFAGFAGIIATFQNRDEAKIDRGHLVGLMIVVNFSLMCAFFSTLPLLLSILRFEDATIWLIGSVLGCFYILTRMYDIRRNMSFVAVRRSTQLLFRALFAVAVLLFVSNALNVANQVFHREPGPYIAGIVFGLGLVGYMFARLLLRPLSKIVHAHEAADSRLPGPS